LTLEEILNSREARVARQRELLEANPGLSLISLTVQPPGPVKRNDASLVIAEAGVAAVRKAFKVEYEELRDLDTGFDAFFLVNMDPLETKRRTCRIEDTHPLGRLMDIDVIALAGADVELRPYSAAASEAKREWTRPGSGGCPAETIVAPLGREELGLGPRKCLLCDRPARECMRARTHSIEELLENIQTLVNSYLNL
jgi:holo-ACP synthase CitX